MLISLKRGVLLDTATKSLVFPSRLLARAKRDIGMGSGAVKRRKLKSGGMSASKQSPIVTAMLLLSMTRDRVRVEWRDRVLYLSEV